MNFLLSLLYAPIVFAAFRHFDIRSVSLVIFALSLLWLPFAYRKGKKEVLYPLLYSIIALLAFFLRDFAVLKVVPLLISSFITLFITISYIRNNSAILYFARKFARHRLSPEEEAYIHRSTLFWIGVSLVNVSIHLYAFLDERIDFWIYYSSIGWYAVFLAGGVLQYLHRRFVFARRNANG